MPQLPQWVSLMFEGAMVALLARWLLSFEVDHAWAVCIGALGRIFEPWVVHQTYPSVAQQPWSDATMTGVIVVAVLAAMQIWQR